MWSIEKSRAFDSYRADLLALEALMDLCNADSCGVCGGGASKVMGCDEAAEQVAARVIENHELLIAKSRHLDSSITRF